MKTHVLWKQFLEWKRGKPEEFRLFAWLLVLALGACVIAVGAHRVLLSCVTGFVFGGLTVMSCFRIYLYQPHT